MIHSRSSATDMHHRSSLSEILYIQLIISNNNKELFIIDLLAGQLKFENIQSKIFTNGGR